MAVSQGRLAVESRLHPYPGSHRLGHAAPAHRHLDRSVLVDWGGPWLLWNCQVVHGVGHGQCAVPRPGHPPDVQWTDVG